MSYYKRHLFFCTNKRDDGRECCANLGGQLMRDYAKKRSKELGLSGKGKIRMNSAGCMDRCTEGPVLVVYPDNVWYTYIDEEDIDEIIEEHVIKGNVVKRLEI